MTLKEGTFRKILAEMATKILQKKDVIAKTICDQHPTAKIPGRISNLIDERIRSLKLQEAL